MFFNSQVHATIYHLLQSHGWLDELDTRFQPIRPTDGMRSPMPLNVCLGFLETSGMSRHVRKMNIQRVEFRVRQSGLTDVFLTPV